MIPLLAVPGDPATQGLDVYVVGGAVRDALMGQPAGDRDWVVVGASPEIMAERGFIPVGGDFPVFLHPRTKEEYALARTERKSGRGYHGFTFYAGQDVSLEDDLKRRDLTMNAMAQGPDGGIVDPFHGQSDIEHKVLRHVGEAFCEDPVRLLRLARFAARFPQFSIAPETLDLARRLVSEGEVDALVPERVWRELEKSLKTSRPDRFLFVMQEVGALPRVLPGLAIDAAVDKALVRAAEQGLPLPGRFALLCHRSEDQAAIAAHIRAPGECRDQAVLLSVVLDSLPAALPQDWLDLIERCDGLRKPQRFLDVLQAVACVATVDLDAWKRRLDAVRGIDAGAVARTASGGDAIRRALRDARLDVLRTL
ncbi:hypothetical protein [Paracandidimonas soli]|uniref:hypothetical protein n=1 Tax=Paracandidimonas soli TaxID=1917182 RepID=UPI003341836E